MSAPGRLLGLLALPLLAVGALLPASPGLALALNARTNTQYAYSYPRRLARAFTVEFWVRGHDPVPDSRSIFSVAHPTNDNAFLIGYLVYVLGVGVTATPACDAAVWCHMAVTVNLTNFPAYSVAAYKDGAPYGGAAGTLSSNLPAEALDQETLSIVLGQEQDSVLGGWDPTQILSGHMDEVRIWDTVRTPQEIQGNYRTVLAAPYPASLVSYYTFDDAGWNDVYYEDKVNGTAQRRLLVADYADAATSASPPPAYAHPAAPLAALALSTAPLCTVAAAAGGGRLAVRAGPGGKVAVPVAGLYCGDASVVTVTVTAISGGVLNVDVLIPLRSSTTLLFTAAASLAAGAGFNYTATDGTVVVAGYVAVLPNTVPTITAELAITGDENSAVTAWIETVDPDRDVVVVELLHPPTRGTAAMDGVVNRTVLYQPPPNTFGPNISVLQLRARDSWGATSSVILMISISLTPVVIPPFLSMATNFTIYRGQRLAIPFVAVDVNGNDPFVVVNDWPSTAQGYLEGQDGSRLWLINDGSTASKLQWADGVANWSSSYSATPNGAYGAGQVVGLPTSSVHGDWANSWCPSTINGGCVNRATPNEAILTFYTEYIEATFATPMYLTDVILVQNYGGDRTSRVLVPSDRNSAQWKAIMTKDLANLPAANSVQKYSVESLPVCKALWPVDRVRIEFDTCHRAGWYELDAVQIRGGIVAPANVLNATDQLYFRAAPGYTGAVTFSLTATSCFGSFDSTSYPLTVTVVVEDTPFALAVEVRDWWFPIDVGQLASGPRSGHALVLELPTYGAVRYNGGDTLNTTLQDLGDIATIFEYRPFRCDAQLQDSFLVQLGPTAVVRVDVRGCTTVLAQLLPIVVPSVVVPAALALLAYLWLRLHRSHRRDNSRAPKDPRRDICLLFTDIQASTMLWSEVPFTMATALDAHHSIMRKLIQKYKCYEVKTIGDSFMVACADPIAALQMALGIQEELYAHDWGKNSLDDFYRYQTECTLPPGAYARLWNGLRVRVGLHCGQAQISFDETTKGYDYYGTVVNTAARIEAIAHGGQVVLSRPAFDRVADYCDAHRVAAQPLGSVQLRGLATPLELVQVLPACFADRRFPPLRLDHVPDGGPAGDPEDGRTPSLSSAGSGRYPHALDRETLLHPMVRRGAISADTAVCLSHYLFYALKALLNMHPKSEERRKRLQELCRQWHIPYTADRQENACVAKLAQQLVGPVVTQMFPKSRTRSFLSQLSEADPATPLQPTPGARHALYLQLPAASNRVAPLGSVSALHPNLRSNSSCAENLAEVPSSVDHRASTDHSLGEPSAPPASDGHRGSEDFVPQKTPSFLNH